jgi:hypothetical protein
MKITSDALSYAIKCVPEKERIYVKKWRYELSVSIQDGPIQEYGVNGVQINSLIKILHNILYFFNEQHSSHFNHMAMAHLKSSLMWLEEKEQAELKKQANKQ